MGKLSEALEKAICKFRRKRVSRRIFAQNGGEVAYGPFRGLKLTTGAHTSAGNLGAKTCGLYEQCVIDLIAERGPFRDVINFGASDGYFAVGVLVAGLAERSICFEMDERGRSIVAANAEKNGVADRIAIHGAADDGTGAVLRDAGVDPTRALLLCDIDEAEFTVLTERLLADLKGATMIIELHDRIMARGAGLRQALIDRMPPGARTRVLKSTPPDWRDMPQIEALTDYDRALVTIDGRKTLGEWLVVTFPD